MQSIRRYFEFKFRLIQLEKSQKVGVIIPSSILPLTCYSCALLPSIALIRHRILPHAILMLPATCCLPHATACCCLLPATLLIRLVGRPRLLLPTFSYLPFPRPHHSFSRQVQVHLHPNWLLTKLPIWQNCQFAVAFGVKKWAWLRPFTAGCLNSLLIKRLLN